MEEEIDPKIRLKVFYQSGIKKPITLSNMTGIPLRTTKRYVAKLDRGEDLERKPYTPRRRKVDSKLRAQIIRKATTSKKIQSARRISRDIGTELM